MYQGRTVTKTSHLPIRYFLALLSAHPILHISMIRVKKAKTREPTDKGSTIKNEVYFQYYLQTATDSFTLLPTMNYQFKNVAKISRVL